MSAGCRRLLEKVSGSRSAVDDGLVARRGGKTVAVAKHRLVGPHPAIRVARPSVGVEIAVSQINIRLAGARVPDISFPPLLFVHAWCQSGLQ